MSCYWRVNTNQRELLFPRNASAPTVSAASYPSCVNNGSARQIGYPGPLTSDGTTHYSIWCLFNDETILSTESYDCPVPPQNVAHDCLNGGCIPKTTYNTPGVFASLAACQAGCAKNSPCVGECVSPAQLASLQAAATNLKSRYCP